MKTVVFIIFFVYAVTLVYPFVWMAVNSLKTKFEFYNDVFSFPEVPQWQNWYDALIGFKVIGEAGETTREVNMLGMFVTSVLLVTGLTFFEVMVSALTAYTVCFYKFPLRKIVYSVIIFALVVPIVGTLPAMYRFMKDTKLLNTIPGIMFMCVNGLGFSFLLLYGSFKSLSWSYAEAAAIDGAGHFRTFFQVMLPLAMPFITATAIITAIGFWNDYTTPQIFLRKYPTIAVGVNTLAVQMERKTEYPMMFACMLLAVIPMVILFACFQKTIMKNMVAGGIKG
ncbi:MAG: carbohydrate ABC transporter permease [Clostridiales bacterium]|nr:carbohydrate ABC transporter permease [Clostridiales bacterium]